MERWLPCEDYEGYYEVSNTGLVRSINRTIIRSDMVKIRYTGKILSQTTDKRGYSNVYLSKGGYDKRIRVHRLVAYAFIFNEEDKEQVNHKDCNKSNNNDWNLEWSTNIENMQHSIENNLKAKLPFGKSAFRFTGAVEAYNKEGILVATMYGNADMKSKGFDYRLVSAVLMGKRKSHNNCTFIKLFN